MIVYGDRSDVVDAGAERGALAAAFARLPAFPPGLPRHGALIAAFTRLGQLVQGLADRDRAAAGADGASLAEAALMPALVAVARAVLASWQSGFAHLAPLPNLPSVPPGDVELRLPEGYAYYALYPEAYALAADKLAPAGEPRVVGLRSIGTGLAAIVAARLGAAPPLTVRPVGHPFARRIELAPAAEAALLDDAPHVHFVVVDEGPGLSGSSFAAVGAWLAARDVPLARVAFVTGHSGGPGGQADKNVRHIWAGVRRASADWHELIPPATLRAWVATLVPLADEPLVDLSGGAWRALRYLDETTWPAVDPGRERIKFGARAADGGRVLVKFAGLGAVGEAKLARARMLHVAGLAPEPLGAVHGFLVERWAEGDVPGPADRTAVARYLGARAHLLGDAPRGGASLVALHAMAMHNLAEALGPDGARVLDRWSERLDALAARARPMPVDGKLDRHEWVRVVDGALLKTDALDHDGAHDLIGAQDLAWDAAGALVEWEVADAPAFLAALDEAAPRAVDRELLAFLLPCYVAFRLGGAKLAEASLGGWPEEAARNRVAAARYAAALARWADAPLA